MNRLETNLLGVRLANPVIAASGTFGFGSEYAKLIDVNKLGAICSKGLTLNGSQGNKGNRIWETASGILNSIGLENPGVRHFIEHENATMRATGSKVIVNLGGHSEQDYLIGVELLNEADIDILELNISCPNVKQGGMSFGVEPSFAQNLVSKVKKITRYPLLVKLTPNAPDVVAVAKAVEQGGADGVSLVNTFLGMAIDVNTRKIVFDNVFAGLSGSAIMPIALRMVYQVAHAIDIPIVGLGGITTTNDALAFIMAGATAVQVGSATFMRPSTMTDIIDGLQAYCEKNNIDNINKIRKIV